MLIEFRVENHRSILEEQVFTFEAGRIGDDDDRRVRAVGGHRLLPVAGVYGANASGKSNVLAALAFMRAAVVQSHRFWPPDEGVPRDPFAWERPDRESLFEVTVLLNETKIVYGFVVNDESVIEEWLFAWPKGRKQRWFERDRSGIRYGDHLRGSKEVIESVTAPHALFLSAAAQLHNEQLLPIFRWFRNATFLGTTSFRYPVARPLFIERLWRHDVHQLALFDEDDGDPDAGADPLAQLRDLLRAADLGIVDFKFETIDDLGERRRPRGRRRLLVQHRALDADGWLPFEEESRGTQLLFHLAPAVIDTLHRGSLAVVDELDASLHPQLALRILDLFQNPSTNPRNAQLLFTTHDTNLLGTTLGEPALRRDQVWLTEKDARGTTHLYPLTDFKPRKSENVERGYLQGRYGAIPFLGSLFPEESKG